MLKTATQLTSLFILSFIVMSCQKNETDLLQEAQSCLNDAPASEARNCVSKISSIDTPASYKLRCAAIYIHEGYGAVSSLISGLNDMSGNSGSFTFINNFNFHSGDNLEPTVQAKNIATANEAVATCAQTGSKAYVQVSSLFKIGTLAKMSAFGSLSSPAPGQQPTEAEIKTALAGLNPDEIGELATVTYGLACTNSLSASDSAAKYCEQLSTSINSGLSKADIGAYLLCKIGDENDPSCP